MSTPSPGSTGSRDSTTANPNYESNDVSEAQNVSISLNEAPFFGDSDAAYIDDSPGQTDVIWTDYRIVNHFEYDTHRYMGAITSPSPFQGDTVAFFQLGSPTILWLSRWTAARINAAPTIQDPDKLQDSNWVLLDSHTEPIQVIIMQDGKSPLYRISGLFAFGHRRPNKTGSILSLMNFGRPPWIDPKIPRNVKFVDKEIENVIDGLGSSFTGVFPGNPGGNSDSSGFSGGGANDV